MATVSAPNAVTDENSAEWIATEWAKCEASPVHFLGTYAYVFNAEREDWVKFELWPAQAWVIQQMQTERQLIILKARQLGLTWLCLGFFLWDMIFNPAATVGIFSTKEGDAQELLDFRLKGMYERLPAYLQCRRVVENNKSRWRLSNGSLALAFPTTGGRGYTFKRILVDEGDHQPDLPSLMTAAKPTIDAGGSMYVVSSVDKAQPESRFKQIYRAGKLGLNGWRPIFLPWWARPDRTLKWYELINADSLHTTGSLDDVQQEYPETDGEALAPRSLDKRIPGSWVLRSYVEMQPMPLPKDAPPIPQLQVFSPPYRGRQYVIGCDTAEGNPTSDDSAISVLDRETGDEVALLVGKFQTSITAAYCADLSRYYNNAPILVERNNHGHAVILWLEDNYNKRLLVNGHDGRPGWNDSSLGKTMLYGTLTESFRTEDITIHAFQSYTQIVSIEGSSLRAPTGLKDDIADAVALANIAREYAGVTGRKTAKIMERTR